MSYGLVLTLVLSPLGVPFSWQLPWEVLQAHAAVLVKHHYLKIENEDTISQALDRHFPRRTWRLWGKNGAVAKVAALNPQVHDMNRLRPGMLIDIGPYANATMAEDESRAPASFPEIEVAQLETAEAPPASRSVSEVTNDRYGLLTVSPEFSFAKISSTDKSSGGSATYLSNLIPGLRVSWSQHWSNRVQTSLNLGIRSESYMTPPGYTLEKTSQTLGDFGLGVRWIPFEGISELAIDSSFNFRQELFARSASLSSVSLDAVMIPELAAGLRYRVLDMSPFAMTLHAQGFVLFPQSTSNYSIHSGSGAILGVRFSESLSKTVQLSGDLWYSSRSQDTSIATQSRTDVGLTFGVSFRFDALTNSEKQRRGDLP